MEKFVGDDQGDQPSSAREVLPNALVTADAEVYQAIADQTGVEDGVMWVLGRIVDKGIQS